MLNGLSHVSIVVPDLEAAGVPDFKKWIESEGAEGVRITTPEQSMAFLKNKGVKFGRIVKESGAKGDRAVFCSALCIQCLTAES